MLFRSVLSMMDFSNVDWAQYKNRVFELEQEGLTTSDAQGVVDAEMMKDPSLYRMPYSVIDEKV